MILLRALGLGTIAKNVRADMFESIAANTPLVWIDIFSLMRSILDNFSSGSLFVVLTSECSECYYELDYTLNYEESIELKGLVKL